MVTAAIPIASDNLRESLESFTWSLTTAPSGYALGAEQLTRVHIADDTQSSLVYQPSLLLFAGFLLPLCIFLGRHFLLAANRLGGGYLLGVLTGRSGLLSQLPLRNGKLIGAFSGFFFPFLAWIFLIQSGGFLVVFETQIDDDQAAPREVWRVPARSSLDLPGQSAYAQGALGSSLCQIEGDQAFCDLKAATGTTAAFVMTDIDWIHILGLHRGFGFVYRSQGSYYLEERDLDGVPVGTKRLLVPTGAQDLDVEFDGRDVLAAYRFNNNVLVVRETPILGAPAQAGALPLAARRAPVQLNPAGLGSSFLPQIALNANGDVAVVYETRVSAAVGGLGAVSLFVTVLDPGLNVVSTALLDDGLGEHTPSGAQVAFSDADEVVVVYEGVDAAGDVAGIYTQTFEAVVAAGECVADSDTVCLSEGRFAVRADWRDFSGNAGVGSANQLTPDTGYFTFFDEANVEVVVKVLDACFVDRFWVFAAGLTDVQVTLTVDDTVGGSTRQYFSELGSSFVPVQDTEAFASCSKTQSAGVKSARLDAEGWQQSRDAAQQEVEVLSRISLSLPQSEVTGSAARQSRVCGPTTLCLGSERFEVEVDFEPPQGPAGKAQAQSLTDDTGYFTFFDPGNVEVVVKVLDACAINGQFWVFAGGLTNVLAEVRVLDTQTGLTATYQNPQGNPFAPVLDTSALACAGAKDGRQSSASRYPPTNF